MKGAFSGSSTVLLGRSLLRCADYLSPQLIKGTFLTNQYVEEPNITVPTRLNATKDLHSLDS